MQLYTKILLYTLKINIYKLYFEMLTFLNFTSKMGSLELIVCYPNSFLFIFVYEYF